MRDRLSFQPDRSHLVRVNEGDPLPHAPVSVTAPSMLRCSMPIFTPASPDSISQWIRPGTPQQRITAIAVLSDQLTNTSTSTGTTSTTNSSISAVIKKHTSNITKAGTSVSSGTTNVLQAQSNPVQLSTPTSPYVLDSGTGQWYALASSGGSVTSSTVTTPIIKTRLRKTSLYQQDV